MTILIRTMSCRLKSLKPAHSDSQLFFTCQQMTNGPHLISIYIRCIETSVTSFQHVKIIRITYLHCNRSKDYLPSMEKALEILRNIVLKVCFIQYASKTQLSTNDTNFCNKCFCWTAWVFCSEEKKWTEGKKKWEERKIVLKNQGNTGDAEQNLRGGLCG